MPIPEKNKSIRAEQTYYYFRIYIDDLLHFHLEGHPEAVVAWYDSKTDHNIRITSSTGNRYRLRYIKRPIWEQVLKSIEEAIRSYYGN